MVRKKNQLNCLAAVRESDLLKITDVSSGRKLNCEMHSPSYWRLLILAKKYYCRDASPGMEDLMSKWTNLFCPV